MIPLDTHTGRMALNLGLTRRTDQSWRTAVEVTAALRKIDPQDPVRFDFALCHHGMSGACPATPRAETCQRCSLLEVCRIGPGVVRKEARRLSAAATGSPTIVLQVVGTRREVARALERPEEIAGHVLEGRRRRPAYRSSASRTMAERVTRRFLASEVTRAAKASGTLIVMVFISSFR